MHKSQGMSIPKVIVNLGKKEFASGLSYTAISRCTKLKNLSFSPYPSYQRFRGIFSSKMFKMRIEEEKRLNSLEKALIQMEN